MEVVEWTRKLKINDVKFPTALVLGPAQLKVIESKKRVVIVEGEAGTGKTTVLLALLWKLSGKHVPVEELKHVVFYNPSYKTALKNYIAAFVDEFCHVNWVKVITELEEAEIGKNADTSVYLLDEVYDTTIERNINRGRIYAVLIVTDQLSFSFNLFSRPDVEVIYFRKIYRSPMQIARCCSKIKRLLDQENVDSNCCTSNKSYIRCLPWEMSYSNQPPLSENSSIVVKSYASLEDDFDLSKLISDDETSKLVVTLDVEKEKMGTLIRLITANENFPANRLKTENGFKTIQAGFEKFYPRVLTALNCRIELLETREEKTKSEKVSFYYGCRVIVLIFNDFKNKSLESQKKLMASFDLNNCEIFVICHVRSSNAIESFIRNEMYQLPISVFPYDDNDTSLFSKSKHLCSEILSPKRYKEKTLIATFDQSFSNIQQLDQIFEKYSIFHLNCSLLSKEQAMCKEASVLASQIETFQEIFFVHGSESEDELLGELLQNLKRFLNERCQVHLINARGRIEALPFLKGISELEGTMWNLTSSLMETQPRFRNIQKSMNSTHLIITFNVDRKISNSIKCTFFQEKFSHMTLNWPYEKNEKMISRTTNKEAAEVFKNGKILQTYDVIILVLGKRFNCRHFGQIEKFLPSIEECRRFFLISEEQNYDKQVSEHFQFLNLCEFCCYGNSTDASIIKAIPRLRTKRTLLLAWNIGDSILATIKKLFTTYQIDTISEPRDLQRHHRQSYDHFILVIDGNGFEGLTDKIKEASAFIGAVNWLHIVCNKQSKDEIESVVMCYTSLILFHKVTLNKEERKRSSVVGKISSLRKCFNKTTLVLSWKVSEQIFPVTFHEHTIRNLENPLGPLNQIFEEVIFICNENFQEEVMTHSVQFYMDYVSNSAKVYLVSENDCFDIFLRMMDTCSRSLQFSRNSGFFGETVVDGVNKIELSRKKQPNVFSLSFSIDKSTALQIDENFGWFTTKHVDTIPCSSRSLPFTGTEFEEVVIICGENIDVDSRESLSVLYNALSRVTGKATIVCHKRALSKLESLLSLSTMDQIFEKIRSSDNLGESLPSHFAGKPNEFLEAAKRIIVNKNEAQFNALRKFISEHQDDRFAWVFDRIQSILVNCFPLAREVARMLNNFLRWRPAPNDVAPNVFDSYAYLVAKKEEMFKREEQFHLISIAYSEMDTPQLKRLAFNAVCWMKKKILRVSTETLRCRIPVDDKFYEDLLFYAITRNDDYAVVVVASVIPEPQSKVVSALRNTSSFVTAWLISELAKAAKITPKDLLLKKVPEFPSYTMVHHFASTTNAESFQMVLFFLPRDSVSFTSSKLLDDLKRNVLMWAVSSKKVLVQILKRARWQKDLEALLKQKDSKGWSCLRHACHVHNLAVVKTLIEETTYFRHSWRQDVDVENVTLIEFLEKFKIFHIKEYFSKLSKSHGTICD